jgi:hypothetical protein
VGVGGFDEVNGSLRRSGHSPGLEHRKSLERLRIFNLPSTIVWARSAERITPRLRRGNGDDFLVLIDRRIMTCSCSTE